MWYYTVSGVQVFFVSPHSPQQPLIAKPANCTKNFYNWPWHNIHSSFKLKPEGSWRSKEVLDIISEKESQQQKRGKI